MKRVLKEDSASINTHGQPSNGRRGEPLKPNTVGSILDSQQDNYRAPKVKPFPLDRIDPATSDIFISLLNIKKILETASNNPAVDRKYIANIKKAHKMCDLAAKYVVEISNLMDII